MWIPSIRGKSRATTTATTRTRDTRVRHEAFLSFRGGDESGDESGRSRQESLSRDSTRSQKIEMELRRSGEGKR